jgi:nucleoside-diphosphate-sugar epimerase
MERVVVVGGAGFLGGFTIRRLIECGYEVWGTHRPRSVPCATLAVNWLECDLARPAATVRWPAACDFVVYLAQSRQYRSFPEAADDIFSVNVYGLQQAMQYAYRASARGVVVTSTGSVYTDTQKPVTDTNAIDVQAQRSYYVATKLAAEILAAPYNAIMPVVQLRIFTPYGAGQNKGMLLPQLVQRLREGRAISLHGRDGLITNPIYAGDVAEAVHRCLALKHGATLNLAGPETLTLRQIARTLGKVLGCEPAFEEQPAEKPPVLVGAIDALQESLHWTPSTGLEAGLRAWLLPEKKAAA